MRPTSSITLSAIITSLSLCLALTPTALAQNALGSGNALDANTGINTRGKNANTPKTDFRARNQLVTGNVVGGRGFRGTVGYRAAGDFTGELGANDLFDFRAASALSSASVVSSSMTFEKLRFGQYLGLIEYRREGFAENLGSVLSNDIFPKSMGIDSRLRLDQHAADTAMHSLIEAGVQPDIIGILKDEEDRSFAAIASSVRGIQLQPVQAAYQAIGLTSFDMARLREDVASGQAVGIIGDRFDPRITSIFASTQRAGSGLIDTRIEVANKDNRLEPTAYGDYRNIMERIAERYADRKYQGMDLNNDLLQELDRDLQQLRDQNDEILPLDENPDEVETEDNGIFINKNLSELRNALRHGQYVKALSSEDQNRFNELIAQAEKQLRAGEYFFAERQFRKALRFTPGHPLATAGLANAQLGAGLYIPAGLTLRSLMIKNPEMIDVRYEHGILPNNVRLNSAIASLRNRFTEKRDLNSIAFLYAYIGHQIKNKEIVSQGLAIMTETDPDDQLLILLKAVWLTDEPEK